MSEPINHSTELLDDDLVAYLDGQLDEATARNVEEWLSRDEAARLRLRHLSKSWDLLDQLPRIAVDETFTRTTMAVVTTSVANELMQQQAAVPSSRRRRWIAVAASVVLAGLLGFVVSLLILPNPNEPLLVDLPVIQNLDQYRDSDSVEFLQLLKQKGRFTEEDGNAPE
ncbi:MAG: hypothetical protein SGJ20_08410 [Planctomycetota bacterium]|nr:hypothetical protein [Planctomycetota bacterium]